MSEEKVGRSQLRAFLLGNFQGLGIEKEEIEERLMFDEDYFQLLLTQEVDLIQDYVDNELTPDEKDKFEKHFLIPTERRRRVKLELLLKKHINDEEIPEIPEEIPVQKKSIDFRSFIFPIPVFIGIFIVIMVPIFLWIFVFQNSNAGQKALASLNKAYATERPFESRITGLDYAPYNKTRDQDKIKKSVVEEDRAERISLDEVAENPTAQNQHLLARVYLAEREFDKALPLLEEAQKKEPQDPEILSDIGVVYLEKSSIVSKGDEKLTMVANAVGNFDKALGINPGLLSARFNKAIALETYLPNRAQKAWEEYLEIDQTSGWADEARAHLEDLNQQKSQDTSSIDLETAFFEAYRTQNDEKAFQIVSQNRELIDGKYLPQKLAMSLVSKKKMTEIPRSNS